MKRTDEQILQAFLAGGKIKVIPAKRSRKILVLKWLAEHFEHGRKYSEAEVNAKIREFHPDFATLRRELYDNYLFDRADGYYWRTTEDAVR